MTFAYPCPECGTTDYVHEMDCANEDIAFEEIESAYVGILAELITAESEAYIEDETPRVTFSELASSVSDQLVDGEWHSLHTDCLHALKRRELVAEDEDGLYLVEDDEREVEIIPVYEPMKTIYEHGPIDGCKDYAVFAMVSWCEMVGLNWDQTCNFMTEWLHSTDAWEEQSWGESSIESLLMNKKHVYSKGLGWKERARNAKRVIDDSSHEPRIDAEWKASVVTRDDY